MTSSIAAAHPFSSISAENKAHKKPPPLFTSTNPSHVNVLHLRDLFTYANHSCHRFPNLDPYGHVEPVDPHKLRRALSHSSVVVSVFSSSPSSFPFTFPFQNQEEWSISGKLVGFGRAISDSGLTASIHDVVVLPSLQGFGIGRRIVNRITRYYNTGLWSLPIAFLHTRMIKFQPRDWRVLRGAFLTRTLTSRGIYDISALCSEKERLFFEACGFGDDTLASTTMIYTKTGEDGMVASAGRKLLLVPPSKKITTVNLLV